MRQCAGMRTCLHEVKGAVGHARLRDALCGAKVLAKANLPNDVQGDALCQVVSIEGNIRASRQQLLHETAIDVRDVMEAQPAA